MTRKLMILAMVFAGVVSMEQVSVAGTDYYVSNAGNDSNAGTSSGAPWATMSKVNYFPFVGGDSVHFERGGIWRDVLIPHEGTSGHHITYTAYGDPAKPKPQFLGSHEMNNPSSWVNEGGNIWSVVVPPLTGIELLPNPSFTTDTNSWNCWYSGGASATGARDTSVYDTSPASYRISCTASGSGTTDIQVYTSPVSITYGKQYKLTFRAKCTTPFAVPVALLWGGSYAFNTFDNTEEFSRSITTDWATYTVFYEAALTATDARIDFLLGGAIPAGSTLWIDSLSFQAFAGTALIENIGNIIFDNTTCGHRVDVPEHLYAQNRFWSDKNNLTVKLYCTQNPATLYNDIELARFLPAVIRTLGRSYVTLDNLSIAYGGYNGIDLGNYITITYCDLSYIGGSGRSCYSRAGDAIEGYQSFHDVTVEHCHIWQIYDCGVCSYGGNATCSQYNIYFRYNTIENCQYAFTCFIRDTNSTLYNIHFDNNTCRNSGGWGMGQRWDPYNAFLDLRDNTAAVPGSITITNNVFDNASAGMATFISIPWTGLDNMTIDNNIYYNNPPESVLVQWGNAVYRSTAADFTQYKAVSGKDANSRLNPCGVLGGKVVLGDYTGDVRAIGALIELRQGGSVVKTVSQLLDTNGNFSVSDIKSGTYDVAIKVYGHERKVLAGIVFVDPTTTDIGTVTLTAGDTNGDNTITSVDLMTVLANMDQSGN